MSLSFETFAMNLRAVRGQIDAACADAGRDAGTVSLLPVTKNHPPEAVLHAATAGLRAVGENRVQEARDKKAAVALPQLQWELIGHLQSNKAALAATLFDRIQSVDSVRLIELLDRAARSRAAPLAILIQVNAGRDPAKFGCEIEDAPSLVEKALACQSLRLEGFMTIAPLSEDPDVAVRTFETMQELRDTLATSFGVPLRELSMGMSADLVAAVRAGSTQVRIGTALFGERA